MKPLMPGLRLSIFVGMRKLSWLVLPVAAGVGVLATRLVPGPRPGGSVLLPSGWWIHPAGRQVPVGTLPLNLVVLSDGQLAVPANGFGASGVRGLDPAAGRQVWTLPQHAAWVGLAGSGSAGHDTLWARSEEHTSELQSRSDLVCRLLLEKKKKKKQNIYYINKKIKNKYQHVK